MNKTSPVEMRKVLVVTEGMKKAGILFVPIPVLDKDDHKKLLSIMSTRMDHILELAEKSETPKGDKGK